MKVQEAIDAYRDGTFEQKVKEGAERRRRQNEDKQSGGVQKGRDLYEALHNKKEH